MENNPYYVVVFFNGVEMGIVRTDTYEKIYPKLEELTDCLTESEGDISSEELGYLGGLLYKSERLNAKYPRKQSKTANRLRCMSFLTGSYISISDKEDNASVIALIPAEYMGIVRIITDNC